MATIEIDSQDRNTILAALRTYQAAGYGEPCNRPLPIHDIATNMDCEISMDSAGIDDLCQRINMDCNEMRRFKVSAVPLTDELNSLDWDVPGVYFFDAVGSEEALDQFHGTVAIKVLDDFEIDVEIDG